MTRIYRGLALALVAATAGCSQLGALGDVIQPAGGEPAAGTVTAEVRSVDQRNQALTIRTQSGQNATVHYDGNTRVVYQNQQYPVTALEQGDVVDMRVQQSGNAYYTDLITVRQSVQERTGSTGTTGSSSALRTVQGTVGAIDSGSGQFELRLANGSITVSLPYNARTSDVTYFRQLRSGDPVRVEGRLLSNTRLELERFLY